MMRNPHSTGECSVSFNDLRLDSDQLSRLQHEVDSFVADFDHRQISAPALYPEPSRSQYLKWGSAPPEKGVASYDQIEQLLSTVFSAVESGVETSAGTQLSYVPGNNLRSAVLGRYIAAVTNRWTGASYSCPGVVALEQSVIEWMTNLFDLGPEAGGVLLSGGSMANFTATVAARCRLGDNFQNATVYVSHNTHHSMVKACRLAGLSSENIRTIPLDRRYRLDAASLETMLENDVKAGYVPMMIVATAGSTDAGAVDPLVSCSKLARRFQAWFHVDAAYGGFFMLTEQGRDVLEGIENADSITVDAHKGLFMPFGLGALLVADKRKLLEANGGTGAYLKEVDGLGDLPDFCQLGPELSRPNRGLEMWLPLHLHGSDAFGNELNRMLSLADMASQRLRSIEGIEVLTHPSLSVVCFRSINGDSVTKDILDHINSSGKVHVSGTTLDQRFTIRLAFLSFKTPATTVDLVIRLIAQMSEAHISQSVKENRISRLIFAE